MDQSFEDANSRLGIEIRYHTLRKRYLPIPGNFLCSVCFYLHADHVASACRRRHFAWVEVGVDDDRMGGRDCLFRSSDVLEQ